MAERFVRFPLKLCLPDPRLSVDFAEFLTEQGALIPRGRTFHEESDGHNRPLPLIKNRTRSQAVRAKTKPSDTLEHSAAKFTSPTQASFGKHPDDGGSLSKHTHRPTVHCSRPSSDASATSTVTNDSYMLSPYIHTPSTSTAHSSTVPTAPASRTRSAKSLSSLSHPILQLILAEALNLPRTVLLNPQQLHVQNNHRKQVLSDDKVVYLQSVLMHPVFLVNRHLRQVALDMFHGKSYFIIDLNATYDSRRLKKEQEQSERCHKLWTIDTPFAVKYALSRISNLQIRLPAPSTKTSVPTTSILANDKSAVTQRSWHTHEQDQRAIKLHEMLTSLVTSVPTPEPGPASPSKTLSRTVSLRRKLSFRTIKSRKDSLDFTCCGEASTQSSSRRPLQNLQIIIVKRSATSTILPGVLGLPALLSDIPVHGTMEYYFELGGRRRLWAARNGGRWVGKEPNGKQLLVDLQALRITPVSSVRLGRLKRGKIRLETAQVSQVRQQPLSRENTTWQYGFSFVGGKKATRAEHSEVCDEPPSVEEIQQLANLARRLY
jgi:hypothetical protein